MGGTDPVFQSVVNVVDEYHVIDCSVTDICTVNNAARLDGCPDMSVGQGNTFSSPMCTAASMLGIPVHLGTKFILERKYWKKNYEMPSCTMNGFTTDEYSSGYAYSYQVHHCNPARNKICFFLPHWGF